MARSDLAARERALEVDRERDVDRNLDQVFPPNSMARAEKWAREASERGFHDGDCFLFEIEALEPVHYICHFG